MSDFRWFLLAWITIVSALGLYVYLLEIYLRAV